MNLHFSLEMVPGTTVKRSEVGGLTGLPFLNQLFFASESVMMATIRKISGIDTSTLQNWVKRGWVSNSVNRQYDLEQVAHILLINMLRSCMQLEDIAFVIGYINGDIADPSDDVISDSRLYDAICRVLDTMEGYPVCDLPAIQKLIAKEIADYQEPVKGAKQRLAKTLEVIVVTYCAAIVKQNADALLKALN